MGGRGGNGGNWKKQLRSMAKSGNMPGYVAGTRDMQRKVILEIDKLYPMPDAKGATIVDQGDGVWVKWGSHTSRQPYPSKGKADENERRGALKMLLYNMRKRYGKL